MRNARYFSIATAAVVALNLGAVTVSSADAAQRGGSDRCVAVSGGTVENATVLDVVADGGTSISDGNAGNAIAIGDTVCPGAVKNASGGKAPAGNTGGGGRGGQVRALPSTGIGMDETGATGSLLLALGALGMTGLSLGSRLDRRVSPIAGR